MGYATDPVDKNPWISPKYRASDWKSLKLTKRDSLDWAKAVDVFLDRVNGRFLAPVQVIEKHHDKQIRRFSGFAILAIDCLLIETLYQFQKGVNETDIDHATAFWHFFRSSPHFKPHFTRKKAQIFYRHFRCGILHQAQTLRDSRVRFGRPEMVEQIDPNDLNRGLVVDRERFHQALRNEIHDYEQSLRKPETQQDIERRQRFLDKMGFIVAA